MTVVADDFSIGAFVLKVRSVCSLFLAAFASGSF